MCLVHVIDFLLHNLISYHIIATACVLIKYANRPLDIADWNQYKALMNVYRTTKQLLLLVKSEQNLNETSKERVFMNIKLFYDNNLHLEKEDRGDAFCEKCNTTHQIPNEWRVLINDLENEMKN